MEPLHSGKNEWNLVSWGKIMTTAISATRRQYKEMADGTLRVQIDVDPMFKRAFLELFPQIDMPVALAPLEPTFEQKEPDPEPEKGGPLARLAGQWCKDERFWWWLSGASFETTGVILIGGITTEDSARSLVRSICKIESRAELDHNQEAEKIFHEKIRIPFSRYLQGFGGDSPSTPI